MPYTNDLAITIDGAEVETGEIGKLGVNLSYSLEDPENFEQKQSSMSLGVTVPATPANDRIFNSFHNPNVEDRSIGGGRHFSNPRKCEIRAGGVEILRGVSMLQSASHTRVPEKYTFNCYGQNGDWSIQMKDLTLWHCLGDATHTFNLTDVEGSWFGFDFDENSDYVYAPVRYRQPFGENDDRVSIYHLRPSISIYWMIIRAFRQMGYTVKSDFLNTPNFFRRLVMPWVWGDFFDIDGSVKDAVQFKAAGTADEADISTCVDGGQTPSVGNNNGYRKDGSFSTYVFSFTGAGPSFFNFRLENTLIPYGFDNFGLYTFDDVTGTMRWTYNPPATLSLFAGNNITANFLFNLIAKSHAPGGDSTRVRVEVTHVFFSGAPSTVSLLDYTGLDLTGGGTNGNLLERIPFSFPVSGIDKGDTIEIRLKIQSSGAASCSFEVINSQLITTNPGSAYSRFEKIFSTLEITSLQLGIGGTVNFKHYDKFRNYKFLDMFRGLIDAFNLSVQTNPIDKIVTIEPTHGYTLPGSVVVHDGYFKPQRLDWTDLQDLNRENVVNLFSDSERQLDFQFKQDGSDGGQNIYAARYKGIYLNNVTNSKINNTNIDNGIVAGVPGAARYMFTERFRQGSRQMTNRFFSATMHYNHQSWKNIGGAGTVPGPAPQLIAIIPDNINDSSASAVTQTFEPKLAFYKGMTGIPDAGAWRWIGDPAAPYPELAATSYGLPHMFAVNYGTGGENDPVLSYCNQKINGVVCEGLLKKFFLKRLAIMRIGKQYRPWIHLNNRDMTNWLHRERIIINGSTYFLIGVDRYNPLSDDSSQCVLWKEAEPTIYDTANLYPTDYSLGGGTSLGQFDLKYAPLLLFNTDLPQVI
jgi:hypothetical protein